MGAKYLDKKYNKSVAEFIESDPKLEANFKNAEKPVVSGDLPGSFLEFKSWQTEPEDKVDISLNPQLLLAREKLQFTILAANAAQSNGDESAKLFWDDVEEIEASISDMKRNL